MFKEPTYFEPTLYFKGFLYTCWMSGLKHSVEDSKISCDCPPGES